MACCCHVLNLLVKDIVTGIDGLQEALNNAVTIAKFCRRGRIYSTIKELQKEIGKNVAIKLWVKTRWRSIVQCLESLVICKSSILQSCFVASLKKKWDKKKGKLVKALIQNEQVWEGMATILRYVRPVIATLVAYERWAEINMSTFGIKDSTKILSFYSDQPKLSAAFHYWKKLLPQLIENPQLLLVFLNGPPARGPARIRSGKSRIGPGAYPARVRIGPYPAQPGPAHLAHDA